jgi:hypothetical protein
MDKHRQGKKRQPKITDKPHSSKPGEIDKIKIGKRFLRRVPTMLPENKDFDDVVKKDVA